MVHVELWNEMPFLMLKASLITMHPKGVFGSDISFKEWLWWNRWRVVAIFAASKPGATHPGLLLEHLSSSQLLGQSDKPDRTHGFGP